MRGTKGKKRYGGVKAKEVRREREREREREKERVSESV